MLVQEKLHFNVGYDGNKERKKSTKIGLCNPIGEMVIYSLDGRLPKPTI
jgi:hypothetical protein